MLGIVCDTIKSAEDLRPFVNEGLIIKNMGNHKLGEAIGQINEGFVVFILETLRYVVYSCVTFYLVSFRSHPNNFILFLYTRHACRPYVGDFIADDPQRRLDIPKPRLPGGEVPRGFLGFAVNMISIDGEKLFSLTPGGHGLRETLFYHLFSNIQVYRSKEDMVRALPCMTDGAISLDGGIIRRSSVMSNDILFVSCK